MAIYTISDLHLSLGADKPMEVFGSVWDNYTDRLQAQWQMLVRPEDTVLIPGDISWATYLEHAYEDLNFIHRLNGKKIILKGNHDYWWSTLSKLNLFLEKHKLDSIRFLQNTAVLCEDTVICGTRGWSIPTSKSSAEDRKIFDREKIRLVLSLEEGKRLSGSRLVVAMHYPPVEKGNANTQMLDIMREYGVEKCVYGHLHADSQKYAPIGEFGGICLQLVSCDYTDFTPLPL